MKVEKLAEILNTVASVKDDKGKPIPVSMQTAMIASMIERDGLIEAARMQALKINELACYVKDAGDAIKEGLDYIARRTC